MTTLSITNPIRALEVNNEARTIEIRREGIQGPPGPAAQAASFQFTQSSPAIVWTINHNIGRYPLVELYTVGGLKMIAGILNLTTNTCQVEFDQPTAGSAILI